MNSVIFAARRLAVAELLLQFREQLVK